MTKRRRRIYIGFIIIIITGSLIWWYSPCTITDIAPSEVSKIKIFNGSTEESIAVTNAADIEYIITNFNTVSLKKEKTSLGYMGYSFRITIYNADGDVYKKFIINSAATVRKDPFFYRDSSGSIDYEYIHKLFDDDAQ